MNKKIIINVLWLLPFVLLTALSINSIAVQGASSPVSVWVAYPPPATPDSLAYPPPLGDDLIQDPAPTGIAPQAGNELVKIHEQDFEGLFPPEITPGQPKWIVINNHTRTPGADRYWDDDDYRAHPRTPTPSRWAAWPARGGANGINPPTPNVNYFNNMDTRMVYGPIDLSVTKTGWFEGVPRIPADWS